VRVLVNLDYSVGMIAQDLDLAAAGIVVTGPKLPEPPLGTGHRVAALGVRLSFVGRTEPAYHTQRALQGPLCSARRE
jgi:hypothetical protein